MTENPDGDGGKIVDIKKSRDKKLSIAEMEQASQARAAEYDAAHPVLTGWKKNPLQPVRLYLSTFYFKNGVWQIAYYRESWYSYHKGMWIKKSEELMNSYLTMTLEECREEVTRGSGQNVTTELKQFPANPANVNEIMETVKKIVMIDESYAAPMRFVNGQWKPVEASDGKIVCRGQVVDMMTGEVASNHNLFVPNGAEWKWDANAPEPVIWNGFLTQLFGDKEDEKRLLQEWMGYGLGGDTWAQKGMIMVGPPRAGKGTIGRVLTALLGKSMVASPALHALGKEFGLEPLSDKRLCLINDAKLGTKTDKMAVIEVLLRVIAGDAVDVNRKFKLAVTEELGARVMMMSNSLPDLADDSEAMNTRFMILRLATSFLDKEDNKLRGKLRNELPGIALWCVEGYRRLRERGKFLEPESSRAERKQWRKDNTLVQFIGDCCTVEAGEKMLTGQMYAAWEAWCGANGVHPGPSNKLTSRLKEICPSVTTAHSSGNWLIGISAKVNI